MHISSPFVVVPVIFFTFLVCILWSTGGTADGRTSDEHGHGSH